MKAKGLSKEEKNFIYSLITKGEAPEIKKGRPSEAERDRLFAIDYLNARYTGKWRGIEKLAEKHQLAGKGNDAIYKALSRGLKPLRVETGIEIKVLGKMLADVDENHHRYASYRYELAKAEHILSLIDLHEELKGYAASTRQSRFSILKKLQDEE